MYKLRVVQSGKQYDYEREQAFWKSCWRRTYLLIIRVMEKEYAESVKYASYQEK